MTHETKQNPSAPERKKFRSKLEFSKKIVIITGVIFLSVLLDVCIGAKFGIDTSSYATQAIVTTGGILGASIVFYLNKSKIENLSKGKIRFALLKLRLNLKLKDKISDENYQIILDEINELETMLDNKLDGSLEDAIQKEIDTQYF